MVPDPPTAQHVEATGQSIPSTNVPVGATTVAGFQVLPPSVVLVMPTASKPSAAQSDVVGQEMEFPGPSTPTERDDGVADGAAKVCPLHIAPASTVEKTSTGEKSVPRTQQSLGFAQAIAPPPADPPFATEEPCHERPPLLVEEMSGYRGGSPDPTKTVDTEQDRAVVHATANGDSSALPGNAEPEGPAQTFPRSELENSPTAFPASHLVDPLHS
jgi:hypothetical protein